MLQWKTAEVKHIVRSASDHLMLMLDTDPKRVKTKSRFIFNSRWAESAEVEGMISKIWEQPGRVLDVQSTAEN